MGLPDTGGQECRAPQMCCRHTARKATVLESEASVGAQNAECYQKEVHGFDKCWQ